MSMRKLLQGSLFGLGLLLGVGFAHAAEQQEIQSVLHDVQKTELEKFFDKYALPETTRAVFDAHEEKIQSSSFKKFKHAPDFFIKDREIKRVVNAVRLRACIEAYNITCFEVPKKYLYVHERHGSLLEKFRNCHVVVDRIKTTSVKKLSSKEAEELVFLTRTIGFVDWHGDNIFRRASDKKLIIIDTEDRSFDFSLIGAERFATARLKKWKVSKKALTELITGQHEDYKERATTFNYLPKYRKFDAVIGIDLQAVQDQCMGMLHCE